MNDLLARGQAWLADQLHEHVASEVTYRRDGDAVTLRATIGRTLLKLADGAGGVRMEWSDRDYLIRQPDLVLAGEEILPKPGDQIDEVVGGKVVTYEVLAPGDEPAWRWADPHRQMFRIHAKHIATT